MRIWVARGGSTRLESLRLYPAIPHKTNDHYSHRPGPLRAPSLLPVTRLKAPLIHADRRLVEQRPVSKLPRPEPEPEALETDEPKLELVADPAALDAPVDDDEQEEAREKLVPGPTQDPLKLYVRQIGDGPPPPPHGERGRRPPPARPGGTRPRPPQGRGRRGGQEEAHRVEPAPRHVD